jgi:putative sigma-54 modulation protein
MDYLHISGRKFELTDAIKEYASNAIEGLKKYNLDLIGANIVISGDEKKGKKGFSVEFNINLAKKGSVVIKQKDKDVYAAIDLAIDRAKKVLRRHHDKLIDRQHVSLEEVEAQKILEEVEQNSKDSMDEIIPIELDLYKPLEAEEALILLKESAKSFFVFIDKEGNKRVLFKKGENLYGIY